MMTPDPEQLAAQAAAVAAAAPDLTPHPHGLVGRIADAHAEAAEALAAGDIDTAIGDIDTAIGADMLASALTAAYVAELEQNGA